MESADYLTEKDKKSQLSDNAARLLSILGWDLYCLLKSLFLTCELDERGNASANFHWQASSLE